MASSNQQQFLTQANFHKIAGFLTQHYTDKTNVRSLPDRVTERIQKTVQHYMTEIHKVHGGQQPAASLNQEVLREAKASMDDWIRRQRGAVSPPTATVRPRTAAAAVAAVATVAAPSSGAAQKLPAAKNIPAYSDVDAFEGSTRGSRSMDSSGLMVPSSLMPPDRMFETAVPTMMMEEEDEDPVVLMKRLQAARDAEYAAAAPAAPAVPHAEIEQSPQAAPTPPRTAPLPQDYIIPQEDIVKYKETEYNIFLTSSDRDWLRNRSENRYNFSVNFNASVRNGYGFSPSVQERFRNIQRIEFVKALLPTESLTTIVRMVTAGPTTLANTDRVVNVFSLPFVGVRIAELNNNGFSTNPREDNTFAIVQYDSTWNSDISLSATAPSKNRVGYTGFIPKFLKCQRVYDPTPLTTLQKMTIRIERHDGELLSSNPDVISIERICLSGMTSGIAAGTNLSAYASADNSYIFIQTANYFAHTAFAEGDLINIQGYAVAASGSGNPAIATMKDFSDDINSATGLYVTAIAYRDMELGNIIDGSNQAGYSNIIIVRSRFMDPSSGSVERAYYGGSSIEEEALAARIDNQPNTSSVAGLINLSRQTHIVLRVITRDVDSSSNIRPDNI
jgi:hypothetical protein